MDEAGFPLQFGDGFAGLAGLDGFDAWRNRGLVANWIVTLQDTRNGGETQRQKGPAPSGPRRHCGAVTLRCFLRATGRTSTDRGSLCVVLGDQKDQFALRVFGGGSAFIVTSVNAPGASKDDFTSPTWGVFAGAGLDIFMFFLDIQYEWSLSDVSSLSTLDIGKSRSFIANAGIRLAF